MKVIIVFSAFIIYCFVICKETRGDESTSNNIPIADELGKNMSVLEGWQKLDKKVKYITNAGVDMVLPIIIEKFGKMNLSEECKKNSMHLISGLKEIKPWAMMFIDSSGKFLDGIMTGSFSSFGSYDECLNIEVKSTRLQNKEKLLKEKLLYRGQYCSIVLQPPLPPKPSYLDEQTHKIPDELKNFSQRDTAVADLSKNIHRFYVASFRLGVCTPSGCSKDDVNKMAILLGNELALKAQASRCEQKEENDFTSPAVAVITLYSFVVSLMLLGSLIDIYTHYTRVTFKNNAIRVLLAFSLLTSFKRFSSPAPKSNNINCLYGIRFLGVGWIILGHQYGLMTNGMIDGLKESETQSQHITSQFVINGSLAVETFLFIGGMLVCYTTMKLCKHQNYKFNVFMYIIFRLLRILPTYCFVLMSIFIMHMLGSGPLWHDMMDIVLKNCHKNWWTHLLFINNFNAADESCFVHFWYLAADFQLYIFALVIILPILRSPRIGMSLAVLTIIASICYSGIITAVNGYAPTLLFIVTDLPEMLRYCFKVYFQPFVHAGTYAIGLLAGYLLAVKPDLKISPLMQVLGWIMAFALTFSTLFGTLPWYRGVDITPASSALYACFNRVAWTLGVAWMVVCCATGHGGIINYILSFRVFVPLGRISFLAYLIHFLIEFVFIGNIRTRIQMDRFFFVWIFFGNVVVSYAFAFLVYVLVEVPFVNIEKIFLPKPENKVENQEVVKENNTFNICLKSEQNGNSTTIPGKTDEESVEIQIKDVTSKI